MATLIVPKLGRNEEKAWPSLGDQVAEWYERNAVFGPGSKFGKPVVVDDEFYSWLVRAYQVYPRNHPRGGRRRFSLASLELAKGTGKTERAVIVGQGEIHPEAPVRTVEWQRRGKVWVPIGGPVPWPRLVFVAYAENQVQRTGFGRFREAMKRSPDRDRFHITTEKIVLLGDDGAAGGEAYPLAVSGAGADGDLPTWQHIDEPHRWTERRHHEMLESIEENSMKDVDADAWSMSTSTAGEPGEDSVEERLKNQAEAIDRGEDDNPGFFFFRRFAPESMPMETPADVEAFVREARGPAAEWSGDIPKIVDRWFERRTNRSYYRRVWGNQWVAGSGRAFDSERWQSKKLLHGAQLERGAFVTLGFDGARRRDSTGLIATEIPTGRQFVLGVWARPANADEDWEIDAEDVDRTVSAAYERYDVWRGYFDPPFWDEWVAAWAGRWGDEQVVRWWTNRDRPMAHALRSFREAQDSGALTHDGNPVYGWHIHNAMKFKLPQRDEQDLELWTIRKERADSPDKIDLAMAGCLSWEARMDAIAAGAKPKRTKFAAAGFG